MITLQKDPRYLLQRTCALTQGYTLDCIDSMGGVKEVYVIEFANVSAFTNTSGVITALTKASGKQFYRYAQVKNTSDANENLTVNEENGTKMVEQSVKIVLNKLQTSVRNEIGLLASNRAILVVVDRNDKPWAYGIKNGMTVKTASAKTGTQMADRNGYEVEFMGQEPELALEVNSTVFNALTTPG